MHKIRRTLPSLTALVTFEASARTGSFTNAASQLGVTQAAVSKRISALEHDIGCPLFERRNRRIVLTDAGELLFATVQESFDNLADTVEVLKSSKARVTIAVSIAFGHFRLLPLLASFRNENPDIDLRVISEDAWSAPDDRHIDLAVRYGTPPFRGMTVIGALPETIVPVCAPKVAASLGHLTLADLAQRSDLSKIESASPEPGWLSWAGWFQQNGWPYKSTAAKLSFTNYSDAAYAAMEGDGIVLGWSYLLERPLTDGRLVALDIAPLRTTQEHCILIPQNRKATAEVEAFARWLTKAGSVDADRYTDLSSHSLTHDNGASVASNG